MIFFTSLRAYVLKWTWYSSNPRKTESGHHFPFEHTEYAGLSMNIDRVGLIEIEKILQQFIGHISA